MSTSTQGADKASEGDKAEAAKVELASLAARIKTEHAAVIEASVNVLSKARTVGLSLNRAKDKLAHGDFGSWIKTNCDLSERTAQRYMQLATGWSQAKLTNEIRHGMADLSLNKAIELIGQGDDANNGNNNNNINNTSSGGDGNDPTIFDRLDTRVDGIIKMLDRVKKKKSVGDAITEVAKIIERLEAKMTALSGEKTKEDLNKKKVA